MTVRKKSRPVLKFFRLIIHLGSDEYAIMPMKATHTGGKCFRLRKQTGDRNIYTIRPGPRSWECDCWGFRRWRRSCKHIRMLTAGRMLD